MNGFVSRGFGGKRRVPDELADRLPPGQYYERGFPVLTAGPTPEVDRTAGEWSFRIDGMVADECEWSWEEFGELPFEDVPCDIHCVTKWSKLGTSFRGVSLDTLLEAAEPLEAYAMAYSYGGYTTNLDDRGPDRRQGLGRHRARGRAAAARARRTGPAAGPAPVLLEEREVDRRAAGHGSRRARLLGGQRLPQPRRPLEGGALLDGLSPEVMPPRREAPGSGRSRPSSRDQARDAAGQVVPARAADVDAASPGSALRRPAHRPRRLHRPALLLDRLVAARRGRDRADDRPARRRRGLARTSTTWSRRATRSRSAARSPPTSSGAARSPALLRRRRLGSRAADGDAPPPPPGDARSGRCG